MQYNYVFIADVVSTWEYWINVWTVLNGSPTERNDDEV